MTSDAIKALEEYMELRDKEAELEEEECTCDPDNFHRCGRCEEIRPISNRQQSLRDLWGDNWCVLLSNANKAIEAWFEQWDSVYDGEALKPHEVMLLNFAKSTGLL